MTRTGAQRMRLLRGWNLVAALGAGFFLATAIFATQQRTQYLRFEQVEETVRLFERSGMPGTEIRDKATWDAWIQKQDKEVRARIDRGVEDSVSNLILYGTSYTNLPRVESVEKAVTESGEVSTEARARVHALTAARSDSEGAGRTIAAEIDGIAPSARSSVLG